MPEEISVTQVPTYTQMAMPPMNPMPPLPAQVQKTREQSLGPVVQYDRNGIPVSQAQYRHSSMPTYMEYSPAPSFVSSHFEDYSTRGLSFEPITPPQHSVPNGNEAAYIANEDTGLYTAIPDLGMSLSYNPLMQMPPTSLPGPQYPSMIRPIQQSYPVLEGSPSYKQRRRRSSLSQGIAAAVTASGGVLNTPHAPHRPSDLRRSVSQTLMPMAETDESFHDSPTSVHNSQPIMSRHKELLELSHQSNDVAGMHPQMPMSQAEDFAPFNTSDEYKPMNLHHAAVHRTANGVYRRARSATISELGPYPHKSHSCPIPMCGRLFKRLEHLKSMPVEDDIDEDEGLDNLDESPSDDANYMAIPGMAPNGVGGMSNGVGNGHGHGHGVGLAGMNDLPTHVDMRSLSHTPMPMGPPTQVGVASGDYS
ncbi:hypothetical protein M8818_005357 [Zalaria obscura]|uniref:Uncharacterized protein n=1 Tax=Zalaria obscura TaxID=2024903 RepID=A0ACC3S936_9PEZI